MIFEWFNRDDDCLEQERLMKVKGNEQQKLLKGGVDENLDIADVIQWVYIIKINISMVLKQQ